MGCTKMSERGISTRKAEQMRVVIATGELIYNFKVKDDIKAARRMLVDVSKAPKYTYLSALHTLAKHLGCETNEVVL